MPTKTKPFELSELEEVAALAEGGLRTDYVIFGLETNDRAAQDLEFITDDEEKARAKFKELEQLYEGLHLHRVTGRTEHPLNEDPPIEEICLYKACNRDN